MNIRVIGSGGVEIFDSKTVICKCNAEKAIKGEIVQCE